MSQLSFDFPFEDNYLTEDFIVDKSNQSAFNFVNNYNLSDPLLTRIFGICGPHQSGKTHLAHIWKRKFSANFLEVNELENQNLIEQIKANNFYIIEDIDKISNQEILFHIYNITVVQGAYLLVTSTLELNNIKYQTADLASRLKNIFVLQIKEPEINLIKILLMKNFSSKQLAVEENVIDYLSNHIERSYLAISKITQLLEFYCFEEKRKITIPLATKVLTSMS